MPIIRCLLKRFHDWERSPYIETRLEKRFGESRLVDDIVVALKSKNKATLAERTGRPGVLAELFKAIPNDAVVMTAVAGNFFTPTYVLEKLAHHENEEVRKAAAKNINTPPKAVASVLSQLTKSFEPREFWEQEILHLHSPINALSIHTFKETRKVEIRFSFARSALLIHSGQKKEILAELQKLNPEFHAELDPARPDFRNGFEVVSRMPAHL
ncbi:MAG: hypothetical protein ABIE84_03115 [bacterium]